MKSVLVIAYIFPPIGGGGVQRTLKFVKYLPSFGWRPVVLTPREANFSYYDYTLVDEIPTEAKIYRTASLDPGRRYHAVRDLLPTDSEEGTGAGAPWYRKLTRPFLQPAFKVAHWLANNLIFVPDTRVGWIPFAVAAGVKVIRGEKIDAIYATGDPWSNFLIALILSRLTGKPFIMDMRDAWTLSPDVGWGRVRSTIEDFWERRCIRAAYNVINITEQATQAYREKYPEVEPSRFHCITQGFDPSDFEGIGAIPSEKFTIASTSTYYDFRTPESFLKALRKLMDGNPELERDIRVRFMGIGGEIIKASVEKHSLTDMVEILPYGPHRESVQFLMSSDVLLLDREAVSGEKIKTVTTTAKVFEYLASGKPILAVVPPDSAASAFIRSTDSGVVVDPEDTEKIAEAIYALYKQHKNGTLGVDGHRDLERFTRKSLTGKLAQLLDEAVKA